MSAPRLLDLFCGAGGAAMGYSRAGFEVIGVDIAPQPHYPFEFHQADALQYCAEHGCEFDAIHASPPCQDASIMRRGRWKDRIHPKLIEPMRRLLITIAKPYVIENVAGAALMNPILLCGTMFGLQTKNGSQLRRHRLFECSWVFSALLPPHYHKPNVSVIGVYGGGQHPQRRRIPSTIGVYGHADGSSSRDNLGYSCFTTDDRRDAMGIRWMTGSELSQAIPPAYTEFIGRQLMDYLKDRPTPAAFNVSPVQHKPACVAPGGVSCNTKGGFDEQKNRG